ncbi:protein disulfide-isomerase [Sphingomonas sp. 1185]
MTRHDKEARMSPRYWTYLTAAALLVLSGCGEEDRSSPPPKTATAATEIAWRHGDVADAFAEASEQNKPVLLYWGAVWCPPCNQLKAGLFRNPDFISRTRDVIPVYLDGDTPGAQAWGERFGVTGYPTLILLRPDRSEVTRLSGTGDSAQVASALDAVHRGTGNVDTLLQRVRSRQSLSNDDWALLAGYGGWHDPSRSATAATTLAALAAAAPDARLQRQFLLQAQTVRPDTAPLLSPAESNRLRHALTTVLADPAEVRANRASLSYGAVKLVNGAVPGGGADRQRIGEAIVGALDALFVDTRLVASERLASVDAAVALYRDRAGPAAPPAAALLAKVRERVAWADRSVTSPYERQAVISGAAHLLADAGDAAGAQRLLEAELKRSRTPYYYMPALAELAEARGDRRQAIDWLRRGYETSEGPASRVQWGVTYVEGLLRLTPTDHAAIEKASGAVISELASQPEGYRQRTRTRLEKLGKALAAWGTEQNGSATLARLRTAGKKSCSGQQDAAVATACRNWLPPGIA